jgi:hypothetical protein
MNPNVSLKTLLAASGGTPAQQLALFALLNLGIIESLANGLLSATNAVQVAEGVRAELERLAARFPDDLAYDVVYDTTVFVEASIEEVVHTLVEAFVLVAIVVFLFLGKLRTTLIPIIAVPVALIGKRRGLAPGAFRDRKMRHRAIAIPVPPSRSHGHAGTERRALSGGR